ncbi:hypothetical protein BS329_35895 [Amycolatopsis coloradensis]|uniref:IrrE N-terminal-like domain-containing protein n=1 Tax=Amycolatopsis coloradensis TaxID=76021 RepID=A0A1R0KGH3_9PSEU|nr:ImmA/IrrE family metallo-endopeptidase [Amycolatopsis coloradensis]OLZ44690.1 hypothetical protein BS329_35895 [Amycolatopsis coloradensis]
MVSDLERARLTRPGAADDELLIELAECVLEELDLSPAVDHAIVASFRDVVRIEEADIDWSGHISWTSDGLVITVNAAHPRPRQRFTALHEVVHTFFPGFSMQTQYRCLPSIANGLVHPGDPAVEKLCDAGAAELLFPRRPFLNDLTGNTMTSSLLRGLATRYEASLEATARRIVTLNSEPTLFIAFEVSRKPSQPNNSPALRIQYHYSSGQWPFIPKYKAAPDDSVFYRAILDGASDEVTSLASLGMPQIDNAHVSAIYSPYYDNNGDLHMRVLAVITRPVHTGERRG